MALIYDKNRFKSDAAYIEWLQLLSQDVTSLNSIVAGDGEGDGESELQDLILSDEPTPEEILLSKDAKESLVPYINQLTARESIVIKMRFGFMTGDEMTLEEIGQKFGVTRERIRQVEAKALRKLRAIMTEQGIGIGDI